MRKSATWLVCGVALAGLVMASATRQADARPNYLKEFKESYEKLAAEADKTKCNICHFGDKKTDRNDYGKAVGMALGAKNVKEADKVKEAIKKAEKEKSATEGKTFGDLIKEGKLPGKNP
jgi:predicted negative regulator of RcsB-dependent stress response